MVLEPYFRYVPDRAVIQRLILKAASIKEPRDANMEEQANATKKEQANAIKEEQANTHQ